MVWTVISGKQWSCQWLKNLFQFVASVLGITLTNPAVSAVGFAVGFFAVSKILIGTMEAGISSRIEDQMPSVQKLVANSQRGVGTSSVNKLVGLIGSDWSS